MGGGTYDTAATRRLVSDAHSTGRSYMRHSAAIAAGTAARTVHPKLDAKALNRTGVRIRESRDHPDHPNSVAVAVIFDTTGSMRRLPEQFVEKLPDLMDLIKTKGYLADPQILFGAVNDATTHCITPLEIGQFESGNQMDDVITNIILQGGGGDGVTESYELLMYFMARHTALDCLEKRGKKGYLFIIGDEIPYDSVSAEEVRRWIGDEIQSDIPTATIVAELKRKFDVYWLFPDAAANAGSVTARDTLEGYFGQNLIHLRSAADVSKVIAATIGIHEGRNPRDVARELAEADTTVTASAMDALVAAVPPRRLDDDL